MDATTPPSPHARREAAMVAALADPVTDGLIVLFVLTQSAYFVNNVLADLLLFPRSAALVDEDRDPPTYPTINVLVPIYEERHDVVDQTLRQIQAMDYPTEEIAVFLIGEPDDPQVARYIDALLATFDDEPLTVEYRIVDRDALGTFMDTSMGFAPRSAVPRTKASALKYAFRTLTFDPDDVVTVFDADTIVPPDTFDLAVIGLEDYDVVQAKQTVRNHSDGWFPRLEAMGMAGWCNTIYTKTTAGPYQLLGKAYFFDVADLYRLDDWEMDAVTEDLTLGLTAYRAGYRLGVIDRYVQDICPTTFADWIDQKRRWVAGPYQYLRDDGFRPGELLRFWVYGAWNQLISVINVVGVPAGLLYFAVFLGGGGLTPTPLFVLVMGVNLLNWGYFIVQAYRGTRAGVEFDSRREQLTFYLGSNPLTQLVYSMLWAIPIVLAARDHLTAGPTPEYNVTPKDINTPTLDRYDDD